MATIYKRGKSYYLQWTENGERHRTALGKITKAEANTYRINKENSLRHREPVVIGCAFTIFADDYLKWYEKEYPSSINRVRIAFNKHLTPYFGYTAIGVIQVREGEQYKHDRLKKVSASTVNKEIRILKAALNKAVEWQVIQVNPLQGLNPPKKLNSKPPRYYNNQELKILFKKPKGDIWRLIALTGLRRSEALQLKWKDVKKDYIQIVSENNARTKSGRWRKIPLSPSIRKTLNKLRNDTDYVLPRMIPSSLTWAFKKDCKDIGGSLHCLRHTFCSHLVMAGIPIYTVAELAGHADIRTTQIYAHLAPEHLKEAINVLGY